MALQQADVDLTDILTLILLVIAIILVAIILYIGTRIITGKKETETGYILRLLAVSVIIVLLVTVVIGAVVGAVGQLDPTNIISGAANQIIPVLVYLAIVYLIKYILIPEQGEVTKFNASIWIGVITLFLIYVFNILTTQLFDTPIIVGV